jgi:hypothetical protein
MSGVNFAIGTDDFSEIIREKNTYIDKSLWVKKLIEDGSKVLLFPRPRRFGKTLNMSMLRYFLEMAESKKNRELFSGLAVEKYPEIMAHQGKYPVLFISLKELKSDSFEEFLEDLKKKIQSLYLSHQYLRETLHLSRQPYFDRALAGTMDPSDLKFSLQLLSEWLEGYHSQKVWILIDEYDTPIQQAWLVGYYEKMKSFMQGFLGAALKGNSSLYKSVLTGILRVSKEGMFSDLNNVKVHSMLSEKYGEYFGFTESEVDQICELAGLSGEREKVREWYNGYKFGKIDIYNPWSLINFATDRKFEPYWVKTGNSAIIESLIAKGSGSLKADFEVLMRGETVTKPIDENISLPEINSNAELAIWSFLLFSGYLKVVHKESTNQMPICKIQLPNEEIKGIYQRYFMGWLSQSSGPAQSEEMLKALVSGDVKIFEKIFVKYIRDTMSYFDFGGEHPEKFYHALVLGMLVSLSPTHQVLSNRESGYGKYDVMIIPRDISKLGIIIEFKVADSEAEMAEELEEAFVQIEHKQYVAELNTRGIGKVIKLGIVFFGKKVLIKALGA